MVALVASGAFFTVLAVFLAVVGLLLAQRHIPLEFRKAHNDTLSLIYTALYVTFGAILGFTAFLVLDKYIDSPKTTQAVHSPGKYSRVRDLMKTNVPTISPQADLFNDGLLVLQQSGLRAMPVTENGELVGMLTIEDIGQANLLRDLRQEERV